MSSKDHGFFDPLRYPPPPPAHLEATKKGDGLPDGPGIYFVWEDSEIVYCGLSKRLSQRPTLYHPRIKPGDMLSFIEFPADRLERVEAFYIGIIYPKRNVARPGNFRWWHFN